MLLTFKSGAPVEFVPIKRWMDSTICLSGVQSKRIFNKVFKVLYSIVKNSMQRTVKFAILFQFYFVVFENIYQFRQVLKKSPLLIMVMKDSDTYFKEIHN